MKYAINAVGVPTPMGPYSQGTTAGRLVFVTGQIAVSAENPNKLIDGGVENRQLVSFILLSQFWQKRDVRFLMLLRQLSTLPISMIYLK